MERHRFLKLAAVVLATAALVSTSVWAGYTKASFVVFLPGIDDDGYGPELEVPDTNNGTQLGDQDALEDGDFEVFYACLNTCTGHFTGCAKGKVDNDSGECVCYYNYNFFTDTDDPDNNGYNVTGSDDFYICSSCYHVSGYTDSYGLACARYYACGCYHCD